MKISKEFKIGIISFSIIIGFIIGINYLKGKSYFTGSVSYFAKYQNISGLNISSPVTISGYKIGQVNKVDLNPITKEITIELYISKDIQLNKNAQALIYNQDLMGSKGVKIINGTSNIFHEANDTLIGDLEEDLTTQLKNELYPLKGQIAQAIEQMGLTFKSLNGNEGENIKRLFGQLNTTLSSLNTLLKDSQPKLANVLKNAEGFTNNLNNNNQNITQILSNLNAVTDSLNKANLSNAVTNMNNSFAELSKILVDIKSGKGTLGQLSQNDSIYKNMNQTIRNLDSLLIDLKKNPKRYFKVSVF